MNFTILLHSKPKDGSLKDVYLEHAPYILNRLDLYRTIGRSHTLEGQSPLKAFIIFTKRKSLRTIGGHCNTNKWCLGQITRNFELLTITTLQIAYSCRITSSKLRYWKNFAQQKLSSPTFTKKAYINLTQSYWRGGGTLPFAQSQLHLPFYKNIKAWFSVE